MYLALPIKVESTVCIMIMSYGLNVPMHAMQHKCISRCYFMYRYPRSLSRFYMEKYCVRVTLRIKTIFHIIRSHYNSKACFRACNNWFDPKIYFHFCLMWKPKYTKYIYYCFLYKTLIDCIFLIRNRSLGRFILFLLDYSIL